MFDQAAKGFGQVVQVLVGPSSRVSELTTVNHAIYIDTPASLSQMTLEQFTRTHTVNLTGSFLLIRSYLRGLEQVKAERGLQTLGDTASVVLIGSTGEHR